jgi:YidC/Oxa1 family membrane protein insertase
MKIYQEYGVSPLAGCMPMLLQMPIWIALYRFFPANIDFRQEKFLWANDLSSYDAFFNLPFQIPFMGSHLSLFTILWALSTLVYTYYNSKHIDMSANPAMKYVQYLMPIMFLGFFNSYASGLTAYMFFSNLINILQTVVTKNFIFDEDKIRQQLLSEKTKPKKKSVFQAKMEEALKQQQALQKAKSKK